MTFDLILRLLGYLFICTCGTLNLKRYTNVKPQTTLVTEIVTTAKMPKNIICKEPLLIQQFYIHYVTMDKVCIYIDGPLNKHIKLISVFNNSNMMTYNENKKYTQYYVFFNPIIIPLPLLVSLKALYVMTHLFYLSHEERGVMVKITISGTDAYRGGGRHIAPLVIFWGTPPPGF